MTTKAVFGAIVGATRNVFRDANGGAELRKLDLRELDDIGMTRAQVPTTWQNELDHMHRIVGPLVFNA